MDGTFRLKWIGALAIGVVFLSGLSEVPDPLRWREIKAGSIATADTLTAKQLFLKTGTH